MFSRKSLWALPVIPALLLASPAYAACPIPVWVNDGGKHDETEEAALNVAGANAHLVDIFEIVETNAKLLGAFDLQKTPPASRPESQREQFIPPAIKKKLPPAQILNLKKNNQPRSRYTPPAGSVDPSRLGQIRNKARGGIQNEIDRHKNGLNDWQYWEEVGSDPRELARERARNLPVLDRLRDKAKLPDIPKAFDSDLTDAELKQVLNSQPQCRVPGRGDLFGPRGLITKIALDPKNAPQALARDIESGKLLLDSLSPAQQGVLREILRNPAMSAAALAALLVKLPPDIQGPIKDALSGATDQAQYLSAELSREILAELERNGVALTPELERFKAELAQWELPDIDLPDIDLPDIDLPDIDLPDLKDLNIPEIGDIPESMKDVLRAMQDPTGTLMENLSPQMQQYAFYLQNPELLKEMGEREFRRFLDDLPSEAQDAMRFVKDPKGFAYDRLPDSVKHYMKAAYQIRDQLQNFHPRVLLTDEMKTMLRIIENPTHAINFLPAEYRQLAKAILRIRSLKDLFGKVLARLNLPPFVRQLMQDPEQFARDKMIDYATNALYDLGGPNANQGGPICTAYTPETRVDDTVPAARPTPPRGQSEQRPSPVKERPKTHRVPASPKTMEAATRKRVPAALPVHGAPLVGGGTTPQAMLSHLHLSATNAMTSAGMNGPDYNSHIFKPAALLAAYSCPVDGWAQSDPDGNAVVTTDGYAPSTSGVHSPTDVLWANTGLYEDQDGSWIAKHLGEARENYLIMQALDSWALQVASANNVKPKDDERELIFESMQKCEHAQCDLRHVILLQTHLLELEMETVRLQLATLNLEVAEALHAEDVFLP